MIIFDHTPKISWDIHPTILHSSELFCVLGRISLDLRALCIWSGVEFRDYSQLQQLINEVWLPCSKHHFVEALCPLLHIFDLDLKNLDIIETCK